MVANQTKQVLISGLALASMAGLALADDITSGYSGLEGVEGPQIEHKIRVNPGFTYNSEADFDNDKLQSKVKVWRFDVPVRYTMKMEQGELGLGGFYEYSDYEVDRFSGNEGHGNVLAFDAFWKGMFNENWGYFVYGAVGFAASTHTSFTDGLTGAGGGGVRYVWSENLSLGVGAVVTTRLEDDPSVLPVIALNWQINDRWNLRTLNGAVLTYDVTGDKKWLLDLEGKYQRREFRLDRDASFIDKGFLLDVGATYNFNPNIGIRAFAGAMAGRKFQVRRNDDKIADEDVKTSGVFGVRALFTF